MKCYIYVKNESYHTILTAFELHIFFASHLYFTPPLIISTAASILAGFFCFLYLQKAFDSVWHTRLTHKLIINKFPLYLTNILLRYIQKDISKYKLVEAWGVAQGSVLAPAIFNFYLPYIPRTEGVQCSRCTALIVQHWRLDTISNRLNTALLSLNRYFTR